MGAVEEVHDAFRVLIVNAPEMYKGVFADAFRLDFGLDNDKALQRFDWVLESLQYSRKFLEAERTYL